MHPHEQQPQVLLLMTCLIEGSETNWNIVDLIKYFTKTQLNENKNNEGYIPRTNHAALGAFQLTCTHILLTIDIYISIYSDYCNGPVLNLFLLEGYKVEAIWRWSQCIAMADIICLQHSPVFPILRWEIHGGVQGSRQIIFKGSYFDLALPSWSSLI